MKVWTPEERGSAARQVQARENAHFLNSNVRWDVRNDLQCELNEARELLVEYADLAQWQSPRWQQWMQRNTPKGCE